MKKKERKKTVVANLFKLFASYFPSEFVLYSLSITSIQFHMRHCGTLIVFDTTIVRMVTRDQTRTPSIGSKQLNS